ncbi:MAG: hypothetical protein IT304_04485, partial [Dehalococcoidia bacterium]|nr:hypothetical protein [Dehalococcoidia bacterium]
TRFRRAIELQSGLTRRTKETAAARARLSDVLVQREKLSEAKAELQQAVELDPDLYAAWFKLYRVLTRLDEPAAAAEALKKHEESRRRVRPEQGFPE